VYDPVGDIEPAGTAFESAVALGGDTVISLIRLR